MENSPLSLDTLVQWLQTQAAEHQTPLIVQARIVVGAKETRLLAFQPEGLLEVIHY